MKNLASGLPRLQYSHLYSTGVSHVSRDKNRKHGQVEQTDLSEQG